MNHPYLIAQAVPPEHRAEVAQVLGRLVAAYPRDRSRRAQAVAEVLDALRSMA